MTVFIPEAQTCLLEAEAIGENQHVFEFEKKKKTKAVAHTLLTVVASVLFSQPKYIGGESQRRAGMCRDA